MFYKGVKLIGKCSSSCGDWVRREGCPSKFSIASYDHVLEKSLHIKKTGCSVVTRVEYVINDYRQISDRDLINLNCEGIKIDTPSSIEESNSIGRVPYPGDLCERVGAELEREGEGYLCVAGDFCIGLEEE